MNPRTLLSPDEAAGTTAPAAAKSKHTLRFAVVMVVLAVGLFYAFRYVAESFTSESTDDAFVDGHVVAVAAKVAGQVASSRVVENQLVKSNELLVELDPRDYEAKLAQKNAALKSAMAYQHALQASFELVRARVNTAQATVKQSEAEAAAAKSTFDNAMANWNRAQKMWNTDSNGVMSDQEYDAARATMNTAQANWQAAVQKAESDASKVAESHSQVDAAEKLYEQAGAQVAQAEADVQTAKLDLSYTEIRAPVDGRVARKAVEQGAYVQVAQNLFAIVRPEVWVTANFKETQLARMRPGQPASLKIDSLGGKVFRGHVDSVQSGSGSRFSLLPPENAVGNYVKVVQRVPVKIVFDDPLTIEDGLGPGMSVEPVVQVREGTIPGALVGLAALVATAIVGCASWFTIRRGA